MTTDLIAYLSDMSDELNTIIAELTRELENTEQPELLEYYKQMLIELQPARENLITALAGAMSAQFTDSRSEWQHVSYSIN